MPDGPYRPDPKMFLPIVERDGGGVFLPGLAPDPSGSIPIMPPGTYPIMGSGEFTGTLMPLADPLPPSPLPLPPEVASVALPEDALTQGIPQLEVQPPEPPELPELPPHADAPLPGVEPLAEPLPTSVPEVQRAWPPMLEPAAAVPAYGMPAVPSPEVAPAGANLEQLLAALTQDRGLEVAAPALPPVQAMAADLAALPAPTAAPGIDLPAAVATPAPDMPGVQVQGVVAFPAVEVAAPDAPPPLPAPPAPASGLTQTEQLAQALTGVQQYNDRSDRTEEMRGRLRAPVPAAADGRVLWDRVWGE